MSYNGSGTFVINSTGQPVVTGTVISASTFNSLTADLGTGLSTAITKDGQTTTTALIPFALGVSSTLATDASSISTGSLLTSGGLGVTKAAWIGGLMNVAGAATFQSSVSISGVVTFTGLTFTLDLKSNTAFATPAALSATGYRAFASTVSGAAMMGFGTTNDVSLMNRAGTVVLGVGPNTTLVNIPAALTVGTTLGVTGATTLSSTLALGGTVSGGGNQINNVIIGTSNPLAGSFTSGTFSTTLGVTGTSTFAGATSNAAAASGQFFVRGGQLGFPATQVASTDPNTLDDYDEYTAASAACSGAISPTVTWRIVKTGNLVTLWLPLTQASAAAQVGFSYGTIIPAKYRPITDAAFVVARVINNGAAVSVPGLIYVASTGGISVYRDATAGTNFTASATAGIEATAVSWVIY